MSETNETNAPETATSQSYANNERTRKNGTRLWSLPHLYAAKAYLLAQFRGAGRTAGEQDDLERMIAAIRYAIEGWVDVA